MRILFVSNAPWAATGYGTQTKLILPVLRDLGCDVALLAYYGLDGGMVHYDGIPVYSGGMTPFGNDVMRGHAKRFGADVVLSLMDVWVQEKWGLRAQAEGWLFVPWLPIDHETAPQVVLDQLEGAHEALAFSRFGEDRLRQAGVLNVRTIPLAVDTKLYQPGDQASARRSLKLPLDRFIIGMVAQNNTHPSRKCIPEQVLAFSRFKRTCPDALLYLHMLDSEVNGGVNLRKLLASVGLRMEEDVIITSPYDIVTGWPEEAMVQLYQSLDVLTAASVGEGFGLPIVEAQACGVPVVTSSNTTGPELTFAGYTVQTMHPYWTPLGAWTSFPNVDELAGIYVTLYTDRYRPGKWDHMRLQARHGAEAYDVRTIADTYWRPLIDDLRKARET